MNYRVKRIGNRLVAVLAAVLLSASQVSAIDFEFLYDDPLGQGFWDPTQGPDRRAAMEAAADIWGRLILPSYDGETVTVRAKFETYAPDSTVLAAAGPNFFYSDFGSASPQYQSDTNYPKALANHLAGRDLAPERHEIDFNVNAAVDFYYGTDGMPADDEIDFISLAAHELGHGLGYYDTFKEDGEYGILGDGSFQEPVCLGCLPAPYDRFLTLGPRGQTLFSLSDDDARAGAIESDNIFWNGASGIAGHVLMGLPGTAPKIFAPFPFELGSSLSHTDDATYPETMMISGQGGGDVTQTPTAVERGIMRDMGWAISITSAQVNWTGLGPDNQASTSANWSPRRPLPADSLVFDASPRTDVQMDLLLGTLEAISFPATAPAYTLRFKSDVDVVLTGSGIIDLSPSAQTIILESPLQDEATPSLFHSAAALTFKNTANAGDVDFRLRGGGTSIGGGPPPHIPHRFDRYAGATVTFENKATAGTASFEIEGGGGNGGPKAQVTFRHNSSAGEAQFRTMGGRLGPDLPLGNVTVGFGGQVQFEDNSRAGSATFHNEGQTEYFNGAGGFTVFNDSSSADQGQIHNHGATYTNGIGGATFFYDNSTAAAARITNHADGTNYGNIPARTVFQDLSNAGTATIENEGSPSQTADPGLTEFRSNASAASATINNRGYITVGDAAGRTRFYDNSTAANATVRTFDGYSDHGRIEFYNQSTAASARIFIENEPMNSASAGGYLNFYDNSTAAQSQITLRADTNGLLSFYNNTTAANARIVQENGSGNITFYGNSTAANATFSVGEGAGVTFYDQTTAANATFAVANRGRVHFPGTSAGQAQIVAAGGSTYTAGSQAYITFLGSNATAANSTITVNGATAPLASRALVSFTGGASAGNATIIANGGSNGGDGAEIWFDSAATGGTARLVANAGAKVDFQSQNFYGGTSVGSIEGGGTFVLRGSQLTAGTRNTSTIVTGQIIDGAGYTGGRLTKVGTGTLTLAGTNTYTGVTNVNGGTLRVTGSLAGPAWVNSGGRLEDSGNIPAGVFLNGGVYAPGTSPGTSTIGGLTMTVGSTLEFELGAPLRDHIVLTGSGNVSLDGTLKILLLDGFTPALGQSFSLFEGAIGSITGAFDSIVAPTLNGLTFSVTQSASSLLLQVGNAPFLAGDYSGNGAVDAADFVLWRKNVGTSASLLNDDTPGVGSDDYMRWRTNFGRTAASGSGATIDPAPVPEPATALPLLIALAILRPRILRHLSKENGRCHLNGLPSC